MNEEQKAIKRLEEMKNNYSLNSEDLHYANVLYYLIINLQQENQQLKSTLEEIREYITHEWFKRRQLGIVDKSFQEWELNDILQLIDKGVNNDKQD